MKDLKSQVDIYDDSEELAQALSDMADDCIKEGGGLSDIYYLKECEVHILGMWKLLNEFKQSVS